MSEQGGLFLVGLVVLSIGGEMLVRGSSRLARALGVPALIIGLTVVSVGTSFPELVVCVVSAWHGQNALVLGNAVGSNIINVLLVLGIAAVIAPIPIHREQLRWDLGVMFGASLLLVGLSWGGLISRPEACGLLALLGLYLWWMVVRARRCSQQNGTDSAAGPPRTSRILLYGLMILVGLVSLSVGANWMVRSATYMAEAWGVPKIIIGLTILALGTSLPELATFVLAAIHRHHELAVGNIIGSNIFNILGILGAAGLVRPLGIDPGLFSLHYPVLIGAAILLGVVLWTGRKVTRAEGIGLMFLYCVYACGLYAVGRGGG